MVTDEHRPGGSGDKDAREATRKGAAAGAKTPAKSASHPYTTAQQRPAAKGGTKVRVSVAAGSGLADESQEQKKRLTVKSLPVVRIVMMRTALKMNCRLCRTQGS